MRTWTAVLLALSALSCGRPEDRVVAEVGDRKITVGEYDRMAAKLLRERFRGVQVTPEVKRKMLDLMISRELLVVEALDRGLAEEGDIAEKLEWLRERLMRKQLYNEVVGEVEVDDEEVKRRFREGFEEEIRTSHILCNTEEEAWEVLRELEAGASFEDLARRHSQHPPSARRGGDMGFLPRELFLPELRDSVWDLDVGEIFPRPLRSRYGFHVVKVTGRRKVDLGPRRARIADLILREKQGKRFSTYVLQLKTLYRLACDPEALQFLVERGKDASERIPALLDREGRRPLFQWKGGKLTLSEYVRALSERELWERPVPTDSSAVRAFGEKLAVERILYADVRGKGYDRKVASQMERRRDQLVAEKLYRLEVAKKVSVTEEDLEAFYREHKEHFWVPSTVVLQEVLVRTEVEAGRLLEQIRKGANMADLARRYSIREGTRERGGRTRPITRDDPQFGKIAQMAFEAEVGELQGPVEVPGGFSVFRVLRRTPGHFRPLSEVRWIVRMFVRARKEEEALNRFLDSLRTVYSSRVRVHEDALRLTLRNWRPSPAEGDTSRAQGT
ncbi:MAG TPA: hypothetical protein EYP17_09255 [Candidatus Latescibacteria bacterium]|nr:hypothetical protein [Candidatus Latescibacterota bacterium]